MQRLYGEALTLRAQFYFELIRNWGDVPASFIPSIDQPNLFLEKTDRDVIYDSLIADLKRAEDLVPWRTEVSSDERITKGAVKALRARLALYSGGTHFVSRAIWSGGPIIQTTIKLLAMNVMR
ncbi:RagB/SusD family nutrient uptake outer membrane protein [Niabella hibiscisoli]|uniref:RagB/SusD family nutrient uptake outer membrane protein n=1 Tax=Niabella hibiscisoli TaxID=1825928 RepID=UPI001F0E943D|nr:RagB/SusD family nutrient uptake outer membrane protein [Niabella hibiscisoli]MCH5716642.1 RagB/SusD family nutrient uptake outer membrane protein [Niabella hibiscisoli]